MDEHPSMNVKAWQLFPDYSRRRPHWYGTLVVLPAIFCTGSQRRDFARREPSRALVRWQPQYRMLLGL